LTDDQAGVVRQITSRGSGVDVVEANLQAIFKRSSRLRRAIAQDA
jgi:hypothetical protein